MNHKQLSAFVNASWDESIIPQLCEYVKIPNKSPNFDPGWQEHGYMDEAVSMLEKWCREQPLTGMTVEAGHSQRPALRPRRRR